MDISEKRRPQDGKLDFEQAGLPPLELRVVTLPTAHGLEDVVMRILSAPKALSLAQLGLAPRVLEGLKDAASKPYGLVFVCGPTGSGKTTTVHSLLAHINTPDHKIWTVEDPVEIVQEGLCQVQVNAKLGLGFVDVLRSFMRADPDVIMVGETRDAESARTVIAASLTGHLVVSTLHTNGAAESVVRLLDFGLDPFNFADAMLAILGQRLVRRLCPSCREPYEASRVEIESLANEYCRDSELTPAEVIAGWHARDSGADGEMTLYRACGCERCDQAGYKGRMGIHELLTATPLVKALILGRASGREMARAAAREGMLTLKQDGIDKVLQGHTDLAQVLLVSM
jgi:type II secretory ATPase GspE/PulE/Tfp pilus assembly ATPase PilB-like protein